MFVFYLILNSNYHFNNKSCLVCNTVEKMSYDVTGLFFWSVRDGGGKFHGKKFTLRYRPHLLHSVATSQQVVDERWHNVHLATTRNSVEKCDMTYFRRKPQGPFILYISQSNKAAVNHRAHALCACL